mmetsp:Transcript_27498/g.68576  ORF Transcript_27498/g.68576 Transcript_27498/m.68576 type:complete len:270 (+) Transcript_27498:409-1218(+)
MMVRVRLTLMVEVKWSSTPIPMPMPTARAIMLLVVVVVGRRKKRITMTSRSARASRRRATTGTRTDSSRRPSTYTQRPSTCVRRIRPSSRLLYLQTGRRVTCSWRSTTWWRPTAATPSPATPPTSRRLCVVAVRMRSWSGGTTPSPTCRRSSSWTLHKGAGLPARWLDSRREPRSSSRRTKRRWSANSKTWATFSWARSACPWTTSRWSRTQRPADTTYHSNRTPASRRPPPAAAAGPTRANATDICDACTHPWMDGWMDGWMGAVFRC